MDTRDDPEVLALARISFQDQETDEPAEVDMDPAVFVALVHTTDTWGRDRAHALLLFGASLVKPEITALDTKRLDLALTAMQRYIAQWDDPAELALAISYEQLRHRQLTHAQAATFATALLDKPVKETAWRKRVDRWAAKQGLPPVAAPSQRGLVDGDRAGPRAGEDPSAGG